VAWARRMLADPDRRQSEVRGMGEFCPEDVTRRLLELARRR
jgi:hypothetical protein